MAALDVWDIDHTAKHALVVVCCRADREHGIARIAVGRVAADMKVNYTTAHRALQRLVDNGYLSVVKSPGRASTWCLNLVHWRIPPSEQVTTTSCIRVTTKESLEKTKERGSSAAAWEAARDPAAIVACPHCDEHGTLWRGDAVVGHCSHQRAVSDLTLNEVIGHEQSAAIRS
jgi:hypothetical protein